MSEPKTRKEMLLDEKFISTPDMGDYLDNNLILKAAEQISKGDEGGEFFIETPFTTAPGYYQTENVIVLSGKPSFETDDSEIGKSGINRTDGDTVYLEYDELQDGGVQSTFNSTEDPITPLNYLKRIAFKVGEDLDYYDSDGNEHDILDKDQMGIRLLGIDAPELPHFRKFNMNKELDDDEQPVFCLYKTLTNAKSSQDTIKFNNGTSARKDHINYVKYDLTTVEPTKRNENDIVVLIPSKAKNTKTGSMETYYYELVEAPIDNQYSSDYINGSKKLDLSKGTELKLVLNHNCDDDEDLEYFKQALMAQQDVINLISGASDVLYILDQTYIANKAKGLIPFEYRKEYEKISDNPWYAFKSLWLNVTQEGKSAFQQMYKRFFGQEVNGRFLGSVYVKTNTDYGNQWVNLAKYLIAKYNRLRVLPSYSNDGATDADYSNVSDVFKLWTYDKSKQKYIDIINEMNTDDRAKVQKELTHCDLDKLQNYTVMIGDCLFMLPPTSIRVVHQTKSERLNLIRCKGGLTKTLPKSETVIEMDIYFSGDKDINGIPYTQKTPNGTEMTYYMNGLRSLIAQYKFTPFLPITNHYINYVLNIEAVTLVSFQVETVPNFPETLHATIKLQDFDYRQYMPEILPPDVENKEDLNTNLYSKVINWPVFRYYYQRCINNGEDLAKYEFNSDEYIYKTVGQKTSLQRADNIDSYFELYVANEEFLKQRKMLKLSLEANPIQSNITFTKKEDDFLKKICQIYADARKGMEKAYKYINNLTHPSGDSVPIFNSSDAGNDIKTYNEASSNPKDTFGIYWANKSYGSTAILDNTSYYHYDSVKSKKEIFNEYINNIKEAFMSEIKDKSFEGLLSANCDFVLVEEKTEDEGSFAILSSDYSLKYKIGIRLKVDWGETGNGQTKNKLKRLLSKEMNEQVENIFKNDEIFIGFTSIWGRNKEVDKSLLNDLELIKDFTVDQNDNDYKVMTYLLSSYSGKIDNHGLDLSKEMWTASNDLAKMKDNIDLETSKSMKYDKYEIGNPEVQSVKFAYNNYFTNLNLKIYDGFSSQYIGGSDTTIEIDMIAHDEYTVNQLSAISRICTQRLIDFRKIISSSPLRINSELTRLMGINEIIIDSVDISTVPNFPNIKNITMRLTSVDRTIRNREAMKKIHDVHDTLTKNDTVVKIKNYFEIKNALAKVELYPDLELPTIKELEKLGYSFIRYKNEEGRVFPDADFYFSYLHVYSSQMLRETLINYFSQATNKDFYRQYSGNLFNNDEGIAKYNINTNKDSDDIDDSKKEKYKNGTEGENKIEKYILSTDSTKYLQAIQKVANSETNTKESEEVKKDLDEKAQEVNNLQASCNELMEVLSDSSSETYNINTLCKISVKSNIPFSQEGNVLTSEKDIKVYDKNGTKNTITTKDSIKEYNNSLKNVIKIILSKPISKDVNVFDNKDYDKFWEVLIKDILKKEDGKNIGIILRASKDQIDKIIDSPAPENIFDAGFDAAFDYLNNDTDNLFLFKDLLENYLEAFARGATAELGIFDLENEDKNSPKCSPRYYIEKDGNNIPYILTSISGQGLNTYALADSDKERKEGIIFGGFGIKKYPTQILEIVFGKDIKVGEAGFLDPYYNKNLAESFLGQDVSDNEMNDRINEYINNIAGDNEYVEDYSKNAFFRIMLCWLYKLLNDDRESFVPTPLYLAGELDELYKKEQEANKDDVFYMNAYRFLKRKYLEHSISSLEKKAETDAFTSKQQQELDEKKAEEETLEAKKNIQNQAEKLEKDLKSTSPLLKLALLDGFIFTLGMIAVTEYNTPIYTSVKSGDLGGYISYIEKIKGATLNAEDFTDDDLKVRRTLQFIDNRFNNSNNYDSLNLSSAIDKYGFQGKFQRVYLKCAENPSIYLLHSFYDMVMTDMRGRMARAFPTYYMLLIDEGRDMGTWRLQDNFYDVSSILEFQVVKSRKIASDTAKITMTNIFGTFTTEDDDIKDEYQYTFRDLWNSVMSPRAYVEKETERYEEARDINRAKLKPGARVSLRMGYSANAATLPIMFNGTVAEIQAGDVMTVICQGDGVELSNPAMFSAAADAKDVADLENNDKLLKSFLNTFDDKSTPRDLLLNPLIAEGTWIQSIIKDWSKGRLFNSNPFGIVHFGDKKFKSIFTQNGEVEQNIYEAMSKPSWCNGITVDSTEARYALNEAPKVRVMLENKSYWDLMHIAASMSPDYICAVAPFQMRSTIFYGAPRYYYAYDYKKLSDGQIVEKRKPFQQYHVYTSYTDIISNGITASEKNIRTVAVGTYKAPGWVFGNSKETVGPLFLDIDIYPEKQKTTNIDCQFEFKNSNSGFTIPGVDRLISDLNDKGGYQTAWRITASGLKETVKDMYTGELIIIGDPSVKPYDKIYINDTYEDMQGMCEVESVTHSFSVDSGFTTSITPDCSVAIDNKYESIASATIKEMLLPFFTSFASMCIMNRLFANTVRSVFFGLMLTADKATNLVTGAVNSAKNVLGKENLSEFAPYTSKMEEKVGMVLGVTPTDINVYKSVNKLSEAYKSLSKTYNFAKSSDITKFIQDIIDMPENMKNLDPKDLVDELEKIKNNKKNADIIKEASDNASNLQKLYNSNVSEILNNIKFSNEQLGTIIDTVENVDEGIELTDDVKKALETLKNAKDGIDYSKNAEIAMEQLKALKTISNNITDLSEGSEVLGVFKDINDNVFKNAAKSYKEFNDVEDTFKSVNAVRKGAKSFRALLCTQVLWAVAEFILTKSVQEFIERKLKNLQVLTVFPLMHNGKVMTAGLDGNKGSVVGSPTWSEPGWIEQQAIDFFNYKGNNIAGSCFTFIRDMFITTPEILKTLNDYKRENNYSLISGSTEVQRTNEIQNLLSAVSKENITGFNAYKQLYYDARVTSSTEKDGLAAYTKYKFTDLSENDLKTTPVISKNLQRIDESDFIKRLSKEGVFKFITDKTVVIDNDNAEESDDDFVIIQNINGKDEIQVPCKKIENDTEFPVIVIPYLRADALIALEYITEEIVKRIQPDYKDSNCKFEYLHKHNIVLHNATMINEKSWMNTGFGFILEVKDWDDYPDFIESIKRNDSSICENSGKDYKLLEIQEDKYLGSNNVYDFWVSPRIVGKEESSKESYNN